MRQESKDLKEVFHKLIHSTLTSEEREGDCLLCEATTTQQPQECLLLLKALLH